MTQKGRGLWGIAAAATLRKQLSKPLGRWQRPLLALLSAAGAAHAQGPLPRAAPGQLAPGLELAAPGARQTVRVQVRDAAAFREWARQALPGVAVRPVPARPDLLELVALPGSQLRQLAQALGVVFVDRAARVAHDERLLNGADLVLNGILPVHRYYPALTGRGLAVSVKENPLDPADIDFRGRLLNVPATTIVQTAHASIMATLIAGAGNSGPGGEGAVPQARIASADYANLLPDPDASLTQVGVSVQNHSYGTAIENYYGLEAQAYDAQARRQPALLHVFSSGNSGTQASPAGNPYAGLVGWANLTGQFKMSKNTLAVGATDALGQVAPLSSRGPAYDGRIKPELVAFGGGGTSDAAALGSGAALLVQDAYRSRNAGQLPPAALVRAALLNSADPPGSAAGPSFVSGYGQLDALGAVRTVLAGRYWLGSTGAGQEQTFQLVVPAGTQRLNLTLAWADPEAGAGGAQALVNDLDLDLRQPGTGARWLPWVLSAYPHADSLRRPARRAADHRNNQEQISVVPPAAGTYEVRVRGFAVPSGTQPFAIAYEVESGFEWLAPTALRNVLPGQPAQLRWRWVGPAATGRLEYRPVGRAGWRVINAAVDVSQQAYTWPVPDTTALAQLRCVVGAAYVSDTVALARPLPVQVGYRCPAEALLYWPRLPGADGYQVYSLGAEALEPLAFVRDTALVLPAAQLGQLYYAVAPRLGRRLAERGATANIAEAGVGCYIRTFLARQLVADTVRLRLELGSRFRLAAAGVQRQAPDGSFQTILALPPGPQLQFELVDPAAAVGPNRYRAWVRDATGRDYYSAVEEAFRVGSADLLVYPVPVSAGEPLSVVGAADVVLHLRLYDALGRLRREAVGSGAVNILDTSGLLPGFYVLRVRPEGGSEQHRSIAVQ